MRKLGYVIATGLVMVFVNTALADFNPAECCSNATHIVLADHDGRVLETWRGDLKPGEVLLLGPDQLTVPNTLPWIYLRFKPERPSSGWYRPSAFPELRADATCDERNVLTRSVLLSRTETTRRLVLFLRQEQSLFAPNNTIWVPAMTGDFRKPGLLISMAWIEGDRVEAIEDHWRSLGFKMVADSVKEFRANVGALTDAKK